ncbi:hypothetical protein ACFOZ1_07340 [Gracilibacillus marinus]|jgi:hypothetical protein|uniref:Uncharacterized protein n=1 Tax=Gracilibacillus marinus TaxID=630535 RepID=A0ABV8VX35_9BACI
MFNKKYVAKEVFEDRMMKLLHVVDQLDKQASRTPSYNKREEHVKIIRKVV